MDKMDCLPSTSKAEAGEPGRFNEDPAHGASRNLLRTGSGNGGQVEPVPDDDLKWLHPLLMPEILAHVFKLCSSEALPSCRLVSKAWLEESLKVWRSSATLQFHYSMEGDIFLTCGQVAEIEGDGGRMAFDFTPLPEFLKFWKANCDSKPFQRFHLLHWEFALLGGNKTTKGGKTTTFWKLTGSSMTSLKLSGCNFSSAKVLRKIIFQACPNLRELSLDGCRYLYKNNNVIDNEPEYQAPEHGEQLNLQSLSINLKRLELDRAPHLPVSWLELLSHFPALKSLTLSLAMGLDYFYYWELVVEKLLQAIKLIRAHDPRKLPIQQFRIAFDSQVGDIVAIDDGVWNSRQVFTLIQELKLPLELDVLRFNLSQDDMLGAMGMIATSKAQLRKLVALEVIGDENADVWGFPFGIQLPNLEELAMSPRFSGSMQFLQYTPNLREIHIYSQRSGDDDERRSLETDLVSLTFQSELDGVKLLRLKEFNFDFELKDGDLRRLISWLPNVEILTMYLNDAQFSIVCDGWRGLEHLHVLGRKLTDAGITGRGGRNSGEQNGEGNGTEGILPNISYLTGLKCFKMTYGKSEFTDVSAFEGFLKLPDLQVLSIISWKNKFGDEAYAALCSKIPSCELSSDWRPHFSQISSPIPANPHFSCDYSFAT